MNKKCFFVTPIGNEGSSDRKRADDVLELFLEPVCSPLGFEVIRVDKQNTVDKINETILAHLRESDLVIVDMTTHNPNVFYEFGYRHALGMPLIPIIEKDTDAIPFDVYDLRTITYSMHARDLADSKQRLKETVQNLSFDNIKTDAISSKTDNSIPLLKINDKLDEILTAVEKRNVEDIDLVSSQVAKYAQPAQTMEAAMMQSLMPMLMTDPQGFAKLAEQFSDTK